MTDFANQTLGANSKSLGATPIGFQEFVLSGLPLSEYKKYQIRNEAVFNASLPEELKPIFNNTLLRKDEWINLDRTVNRALSENLVLVSDLQGAGLTVPLANLGVTVHEYEIESDLGDGIQSMAGIEKSDKETIDFALAGVPVPITHKDFEINLRRLLASRNSGSPLDVTKPRLAAQSVARTLERTVANGSGVVSGGYTAYGYTNHPNRITGSVTADWTNTGSRDILKDVRAMLAAASAYNMEGPYVMYLSNADYEAITEDYKANSERTYMDRILADGRITAIKKSHTITAGEVVMVHMVPEAVQLAVAENIQTIRWSSGDGFLAQFKTMGAMVPVVKKRWFRKADGTTGYVAGVIHYS